MAPSIFTEPLQKAQQIIMGSGGDKIGDLERNTRDGDKNSHMTSDFGVRQSNTDDWLRVVSDDKTGPSLLEDVFGREKVRNATTP